MEIGRICPGPAPEGGGWFSYNVAKGMLFSNLPDRGSPTLLYMDLENQALFRKRLKAEIGNSAQAVVVQI